MEKSQIFLKKSVFTSSSRFVEIFGFSPCCESDGLGWCRYVTATLARKSPQNDLKNNSVEEVNTLLWKISWILIFYVLNIWSDDLTHWFWWCSFMISLVFWSGRIFTLCLEKNLNFSTTSVLEFWRTAGFNNLCTSIFFQNAAADKME